MSTNEITEALSALAAKAADSDPRCGSSGEPLLTWTKVVNGHHVQARINGWAEVLTFELRYVTGTQPLTLAEAAELVAA